MLERPESAPARHRVGQDQPLDTVTHRVMAGAPARVADRIDTRPRFTAADAVKLNRLFRGSDTVEMLTSVLREGLAGDIAVVSSFGAESAVLLHLVGAIDPAVPVLFLDTGKHFAETLAYRDLLTARLGLTDVRSLTPDPALLAKRDESGLRWSYDPDGCCAIRKVQPLERALAGFDATLTGRKAFQAATRANLPRFEIDTTDAQGRLKINPLADWSRDDLAAYVVLHDLPPHPLVAQGYPSIGCSPCTSMVTGSEDARAGRWRGWDKTECGIHVPGVSDAGQSDVGQSDVGQSNAGQSGATHSDLPPDYDPVF